VKKLKRKLKLICALSPPHFAHPYAHHTQKSQETHSYYHGGKEEEGGKGRKEKKVKIASLAKRPLPPSFFRVPASTHT